jgi:integrase
MATTVYKRKSKITGAISFAAQARIDFRYPPGSKNSRPTNVKPVYTTELKTFRVTTDVKTARAEAEEWAKVKEQELIAQAKQGVKPEQKALTVGSLIDDYLQDPKIKQLKGYDQIDRLLGWWLAEFSPMLVLDFDDDTMRAGRNKLTLEVRKPGHKNKVATKKREPGTVNRYVSAMRACWNWGRRAKKIPKDRTWAEDLMLTEPQGRIRFLDDAERVALLKAAEANPVTHTAILVSIACGMRQDELLKLQWKDIDFDKSRVTMHETKNGTRRTVHVPSSALAALQALKKAKVVSAKTVFLNSEGAPLTSSVLIKRFKKLLTKAGIKNFKWHDLRHTCASYLAQNGASLLEIGSVLGHKSPGITMRYAHLVSGAQVTGHAALDKMLGAK